MKKLIAAIAAGVVAFTLGACSSSQIQTAATNVAAVNGAAASALQTVAISIVAACPAGEAFISAAAAATANPDAALAEDANGLFCAVNKAIAATAASTPAAASTPLAGAPIQ